MFKLPTLTLIAVASLLASNPEASHAAVVRWKF